MKLQRRITTRECPAPRPSVVCDRALGDDATIGVDANLALDPVVSNLANPADASNTVRSRLAGLRRIQPLGVGYSLDKSKRVAGIGAAMARDLLAEMALYRRQAVAVPLLGFGIGGGLCVARRGTPSPRARRAQWCMPKEVPPCDWSSAVRNATGTWLK